MHKYQVKISIKINQEQHDELLNYLTTIKEGSKLNTLLGASFYHLIKGKVDYCFWLIKPDDNHIKADLTAGSEVILLGNDLLIKDQLGNLLKEEKISKMKPEDLIEKLINSVNEYL